MSPVDDIGFSKKSKKKKIKTKKKKKNKPSKKKRSRRKYRHISPRLIRSKKRLRMRGRGTRMPEDEMYSLLGIGKGCTKEELRSAYHTKSLLVHPDRNKREDAKAEFNRINMAYEGLNRILFPKEGVLDDIETVRGFSTHEEGCKFSQAAVAGLCPCLSVHNPDNLNGPELQDHVDTVFGDSVQSKYQMTETEKELWLQLFSKEIELLKSQYSNRDDPLEVAIRTLKLFLKVGLGRLTRPATYVGRGFSPNSFRLINTKSTRNEEENDEEFLRGLIREINLRVREPSDMKELHKELIRIIKNQPELTDKPPVQPEAEQVATAAKGWDILRERFQASQLMRAQMRARYKTRLSEDALNKFIRENGIGLVPPPEQNLWAAPLVDPALASANAGEEDDF